MRDMFIDLAQVVRNLVNLRQNAAILDELDVACSFATLAEEQNLVRPTLNLGYESQSYFAPASYAEKLACRMKHRVVGGRHPMVEVGLASQGRQFTPNNCAVGDEERILLITGYEY